jgi:uncharacterized membrane protein
LPYREDEDRLGAEERDGEAVRELGRWRDRVRARILLIAALVGLVFFFYVVRLQFQKDEGIASVRIGILVATVFFVAAMFAGRQVGRIFVARRMDAKIDELAKAYEIPRATLAATGDLLHGL